eukprot:m.38269 g.38269  ORF g.38269 m.38269 type:complete len:1062 (-) comp10185_c0_seq1:689-3874(-)
MADLGTVISIAALQSRSQVEIHVDRPKSHSGSPTHVRKQHSRLLQQRPRSSSNPARPQLRPRSSSNPPRLQPLTGIGQGGGQGLSPSPKGRSPLSNSLDLPGSGSTLRGRVEVPTFAGRANLSPHDLPGQRVYTAWDDQDTQLLSRSSPTTPSTPRRRTVSPAARPRSGRPISPSVMAEKPQTIKLSAGFPVSPTMLRKRALNRGSGAGGGDLGFSGLSSKSLTSFSRFMTPPDPPNLTRERSDPQLQLLRKRNHRVAPLGTSITSGLGTPRKGAALRDHSQSPARRSSTESIGSPSRLSSVSMTHLSSKHDVDLDFVDVLRQRRKSSTHEQKQQVIVMPRQPLPPITRRASNVSDSSSASERRRSSEVQQVDFAFSGEHISNPHEKIPSDIAALLKRIMDHDWEGLGDGSDREYLQFVNTIALHARDLMGKHRKEFAKHAHWAATLRGMVADHSAAEHAHEACTYCVCVRVGGGYILIGLANATGRCVGCGRPLTLNLADAKQGGAIAQAMAQMDSIAETDSEGASEGKDGGDGGAEAAEAGEGSLDALSFGLGSGTDLEGALSDVTSLSQRSSVDDGARLGGEYDFGAAGASGLSTNALDLLVGSDDKPDGGGSECDSTGATDPIDATNSDDGQLDGSPPEHGDGPSSGSDHGDMGSDSEPCDVDAAHSDDNDHNEGKGDEEDGVDGVEADGSEHDDGEDDGDHGTLESTETVGDLDKDQISPTTPLAKLQKISVDKKDLFGHLKPHDTVTSQANPSTVDGGEDEDVDGEELGRSPRTSDGSDIQWNPVDPEEDESDDQAETSEQSAAARKQRRKFPNVGQFEDDEDDKPARPVFQKLDLFVDLDSDLEDDFDESSSRTLSDLARFCIIPPEKLKQYKAVFKAADRDQDSRLDLTELGAALRTVNHNLMTPKELEFVLRVLDIVYLADGPQRLKHKLDFRLFSVVAALSERVSQLDGKLKHMINHLDYDALESKLKTAKDLFYCNDVSQSGTIELDAVAVELQAGNFHPDQTVELINTLEAEGLEEMTFLDYLAYIPLFLDVHANIMTNPLDETKDRIV